jgi:REP element-mobilizing transposase RayT
MEGAIYHVYNRFGSGEGVFQDEGEVGRFFGLLRHVKRRDGWVVLAWSVLHNHYHLAVRTGPVPLSRSMHTVQGRFSQTFNARHRRSGAMWQSRYQARLVGEGDYLRQLIVYVHVNPVRAGLVADPADHRWSGHGAMLGRRRARLLDVDDALLAFGQTRREARRVYRSAVRAALAEDGADVEPARQPWWSRDAALRLREDVAHIDEPGRSTGPERCRVPAAEFVRLCSEVLGVPVEELQSRRRGDAVTRARELLATVGVTRWGQSTSALSRELGMYPDSISRQVTRA